jgi:amino acid adenylation domain-containing protein/non-ribosomal peptide synthase protein (TIGR01720 family)
VNKKNLGIKGRQLETLLINHPQVSHVKINLEQNKQIIYFVSNGVQSPKKYELRQYLKKNTTDDLSSTIFVEVPSLEEAKVTSFPIAPSTTTEELLAEIWEIWGNKSYTSTDETFVEEHLVAEMVDHVNQTFEVELLIDFALDTPLMEVAEYIDSQLKEISTEQMIVDKQKPVVLSSSQQRLWFWEQLVSGTTVYSVPAAYRLVGDLHVEKLKHSFEMLLQRHVILRATFHANEHGIPVQQIHPQLENWFSYEDLQNQDHSKELVDMLIAKEIEKPFDLIQGPLFRVFLYQLENDWRLLILAHHLVMDGWSLGVLVRDLFALYDGDLLLELKQDYLDYAVQEQAIDWEKEKVQLSYWKEKLSDLPTTQLATDFPRTAIESYRGSAVTVTFPANLVTQLQRVAQTTGSSLYMILLSAFQLLLSRYSGGKDVVVGSPVAGRFQSEWEKVIGYFVNTIVLRTDLSGNPTWNELINRVKETVLDAFSHQQIPFDKVVETVLPDRQLSTSPLFQAMFVLQNMDLESSTDSSLQLEPIILPQTIAKFDLTLTMVERKEELVAILEYNTDLFEASTIHRMLEQLEMLFRSLSTDQTIRIDEVNMVTTTERENWLELNHTEKLYSLQNLSTIFEEQVAQYPDAIAIQFEKQTCTYQELNDKANQMARFLASQGIRLGDKVGICLERSMELYISILGTVKLGAVYVPFDVNTPTERLIYQIQDAGISIVLTSSKFADRFDQELFSCKFWEQIELQGFKTNNFMSPVTIDSLTYIMYTSGSTGHPKGVEITARGIVRLVQKPNYIDIDHSDVFLQMAPIAFDAATLEIWGAFLNGAKLVIMPPAIPTLEEISDVIRDNQVTTLWLTAGLFQFMVDEHLDSLKGLRYLLTGGDVVSATHVKRVLALNGPTVINGYGPTENTTFTCCYAIPADWDGNTSVPIGSPITGTYVYILDEHGNEVPQGVPGELYIGGDGLALGYANRPDLTKEKFVTIPDKGRLYRSGDLVRYSSDGMVQFIGRLDYQVKIRGFRVELGEIEAVIATHSDISDAVVLAKEGKQGGKQLVAYLKTDKTANWKLWLEGKLPSYMIPSIFVELSSFPLTSNGKVDRRKLDSFEITQETIEQVYAEPVTKEERQLYSIWSDVLGHSQFGLHDNFFSIGGHSLLATQIIARIHKVSGVSLPLQSLFAAPTIAGLALYVKQSQKNQSLFSIQVEKTDKIPASFGQKRLWFFDQYTSEKTLYHMPIVVEVKGSLEQTQLKQSYLELLERHTGMRTAFYFEEGQLLQQITEPSNDCFQYEDLRLVSNPEIEARKQISQMTAKPFDLSTGPLARLCAYQMTDEKWYLLFHMHHIVGDGASLSILIDEFFKLYQGKKLPKLPIQYADYAWQEQAWMETEEMQQELAYWKEQLADLPVLDLPTDHPRRKEQTFAGATYAVTFPSSLREGLAEVCEQHGATFYMTGLAVFQALLSRYTGATDIAIGSPIAGRSHVELEQLIGFFVNTLVFRTDLSGELTWNELLQRVKRVAVDAFAHATVPFERVVEEVAPDRHLSHSPLFQVMFSVENETWKAPPVEGLAIQEVELPQTTAKFDLTLHLTQLENGIEATFSYNTDLWEEATIARMAGHLEQLMKQLVEHPEQPIQQATLLTDAEIQEQQTWNEVGEALPFVSVVEQIAQVVRATPDALAIVTENEAYTYEQWWHEATQLAHYLQKRGAQPGKVVALCSDRSPSMLVGMLAILQTGATYLPIDPHYPIDRIQYLVRDAWAQFVLVESSYQSYIDMPASQIITLDTGYVDWMEEPTTPLKTAITPTDIAYLIYTSGSTGQPKGVAVSHASLSHLIHWHRSTYLCGTDRGTWIAGVAFDASVWEIWPTLASGASLYLPPEELRLDPVGLRDWLLENEITVSFVPTPLLEQLLSLEWPDELALKWLLTGGDQLRTSTPAGFPVTVINHYGPTENTVVATAGEVPAGSSRLPTIGRPICGVTCYVLDAHGQMLPIGIPGELYIGGRGVAQGYHGRPDWTQERFLDHPNWGRLYRTGDIVHWDSTGELHFVGRKDTQVSIRGFRVELGEIEGQLQLHPNVEQAVVAAHTGRLVAYVQGEGEPASWKTWLSSKLPDYMVPAVFHPMEHFPLTANGKIDRNALPEPIETNEQDYTAAETEQEAILIAIWEEVLGKSPIGIHDNFFQLGGDSILSIQVVSRAREKGMVLKPKQLFAHQTIAALASVAESEEAMVGEQGTLVGEVPLLPIQKWFLEQTKHPHHFNQSMLLQIGKAKEAWLQQTIQELIAHHDALRMRWEQTETGWTQSYQAEGYVQLEVVDLRHEEKKAEVLEQKADEAQASLHLTEGPVFRAIWFPWSKEEGRLLLIAHHLVMDGVSWRIVLEDIETIYSQVATGKPITLPAKTSSYRQWAEHLQARAMAAEIESQRFNWEKMQGSSLPLDKSGENTEASVEQVQLILSSAETKQLITQTTQNTYASVEEILLTALSQSLHEWTGEQAHVIHMEGHGREEQAGIDLSRTVGWFTSLYPVVLKGKSFDMEEVLQDTKDMLREASKRSLSYGLLRHLHPTPLQGPTAPISFNYLGQFSSMQKNEQAQLIQRISDERTGNASAKEAVRPHLIDVVAVVMEEKMHITMLYSKAIFHDTTMHHFLQQYSDSLQALQTAKIKKYSLTDFPLADLQKHELSEINGKELEAVYPLSPLQNGMLFHSLYQHEVNEYVVQIGFILEGELDLSTYQKAWQAVIDRNAVLRTTFLWEGLSTPHQLVHRHGHLHCSDVDWRHLAKSDQADLLEAYLQQDRAQGFDVKSDALSRVHFIRLTDDSYQVIWSYHHLLIDGWSMPLLLNELMATYEAMMANLPVTLPAVRPFADYMNWIARQDREEAKQYWQQQLAGYESPVQLSVMNPKMSSKRKSVEAYLSFSKEKTADLTAFCRDQHITLHTLLQGTWSLLLQAFSGETDLVYGTTVAGRPAELRGVETMVGMMINTLPVRVRMQADVSVRNWLSNLQKSFQNMRQFEYCSLVEIQQWSDMKSNENLFDYLFVFENYPASEQAKEPTLSMRFTHGKEEVHYPLTLVAALGEQLHFKWMYHKDRFSTAVIEQLQSCFASLLDQLITNQSQTLRELTFHSTQEQRLLQLWAGEDTSVSTFVSIDKMVQQQAEKVANQLAMVEENAQISYKMVEESANKLAHYLIEQGIGCDSRVAIFMERSIFMVVAQLAVLKTGAAYVPLDPDNPIDRIQYQIQDANVATMITSKQCAEEYHLIKLDKKIVVGLDDHKWRDFSTNPPETLISADQVAYLIYTSGSTGLPKGVAIKHGSLSELIHWHISAYKLGTADHTSMIAGVAFDASVWEIWSALAAGSTIYIPADSIRQAAEELQEWLLAKEITQCFVPTPLLEQLMELDWIENSKLHTIWTGGDRLRRYPAASFAAKVVNHYGPTESTVVTTAILLDQHKPYLPPIGRPIPGRKVYVLDSLQRLVPIGVVGELWIGGSGLAKEYWNQPQTTAERFVHHPTFGRIYQTGDMVKWLDDGTLSFVGRNDAQVKINGYRLELGEIEAVLTSYPTIIDAVVIAVDHDNRKQLVAYVVSDQEEKSEWKTFLLQHLPVYMVPDLFVNLESLPLTANGKLDRSALPKPNVADEYQPPQGDVEKKLCEIWSSILEVEQMGATDNVFLLGAHSLLVTRAISQINKIFQAKLPLQVVFENPTVRSMATQIPVTKTEQSIPIRDRTASMPLSYAEKRLWLMDQLLDNKEVYNIPVAFESEEELDLSAWKFGLEQMMIQHEILRTSYRKKEDGIPIRVISEEITVPLYVEEDEEQLFWKVKQPFDLSVGPLWRVMVTKDLKQCWIVMHHIITDGWSFHLFFDQLCSIYQAKISGKWKPKKSKALQYADYAAWQETQLFDASYWKEQLADLSPLALPTDFPRPKVQTSRGAAIAITWETDIWNGIKALAKQSNATLFMTLLAMFQVLLHRYSGQDDIAVGTPVANREQLETEKMIGFFVNTLVMRGDLTGNPSFRSFVQKIRRTALDAYQHQSIPFEKVVEEVDPERSMDHSPLFQVMFTLQEEMKSNQAGFAVKALPITTSKYDMTLSIGESSSGAELVCEYNTDLFMPETIERLFAHFSQLAHELIENPDLKIGEVQLLTSSDEYKSTEKIASARLESSLSIQERIMFQAISTPTAIALEEEHVSITYRELNQKANQVAQFLRKQGVMTGDFVGICLERSCDLIISALAILKLGASYVPIDPAYPEARVQYLIEDAQLSLIISHSSQNHKLTTQVYCLDQIQSELDLMPVDEIEGITPITDVAYMIYTSGSTGLPKGVMISHESLLHLVQWHSKAYTLTPLDRTTLIAGPAFDASVWEIWPTLASGGTLVIPSEETKLDAQKLQAFLIQQRISVSFLPTPLLESLLELDWPSQVSLRYLLTGGDVLRIYPPNDFPVRVVNHYGPTENTVVSTAIELKPSTQQTTPPIGKPIDHVTVYILDKYGNQVPIGVAGELYVGGAGLAIGYYNQEALTKEKFIHHPIFGRLYQTGDIVKRLADGNLHFLGRRDRQVKIRGLRIELGEIEAGLRQLDSVSEAIVMEQTGQLVAYIVPKVSDDSLVSSWQDQLHTKLPSYMVPTYYVLLDAIPLSANGKIDRSKLPKIEFSQTKRFVAPQTKEEKLIVSIWEEVLGVTVGISDNFFQLGGHSLLAAKVIARMNQVLHQPIRLRQLFETPTIAGILANAKNTGSSLQFQKEVRPKKIPLSSAQERLWIFHKLQPDSVAYHIPLAIKLTGELNVSALEAAFHSIVHRHESLRTIFYQEHGKVYQAIRSFGGSLVVQDCSMEDAVTRMHEDLQTPFDLIRDRLYRAYLYQVKQNVSILYLNLHHIIADGRSIQQLLQELWAGYTAICQQGEFIQAELPIQYADYAWQEQAWMETEEMQQELAYWKEQLADLPILDLPTDHPRGKEQTFAGATYAVTLPASLREGLAEVCEQHGATFYMTGLAVFQALLSRYTGATDIAIGSPIAGRSHVELEQLIGFFVNTLVFRTDLSGELTWNELLQRVKRVAVDAFAHATVPFERVVEEVAPDRHLSHSPLFQVMFSVENETWKAPPVEGLAIQEVELPQTTAKFDLTLHLTQLENGIEATFSYNTDLWEEATIARMAGHLEQLMKQLVEHPEQPIQQATLLTDAEIQEQQTWNEVGEALPFVSVVEQIAQVVRATPDALAIVTENEAYTYEQWWHEATQLAHYLQKRGAQPGKVVALCSDRSPSMLVGMLAILQTGATYLPIDPHYPIDRIQYLVRDAWAQFVLVESSYQSYIDMPASQIITLDTGYVDWMEEPTTPLKTAITPTDIAYLIYTSGSTGQPKGVAVSHASLSHLIHWHRSTYLCGTDRGTWIAGVAFDASVWEIWPTLASGASLYLPPEELRLDPVGLRDWLLENEITVSFVPTPLLEQLLSLEWPDELALKWLLTGGDQLRTSTPAGFPVTVINHYGPTENTVVATAGEVPAGSSRLPTIGRPICGVTCYVLDAHGQMLPIGIPGELYIGGRGVAQGYHGRPDWTQERFLDHPNWGRLYRTGDIVHWDSTGELHFVGRKDTQVSIRGFRVELGEIEGQLQLHPNVEQAVVAAHTGRLVAYVQGEGEPASWKTWLSSKLPDYMVPAVFHPMEHFPLTANGKIDRNALPEPIETNEQDYTAAETEQEAILIAIWEEVLGKSPIGIHDNFFQLGGDSILSIQVVSRAREKGMVLKPKQLFAHQTIAALASVAESEEAMVGEQGTLVGEVPLLPIQKWFLEQTKHPHHFNQSMLLQIGKAKEAWLQQTIQELIAHHDALRMRWEQTETGWTQSYQAEGYVQLEVVDLRHEEKKAEVLEQKADEAQASLHLTEGPVFRAIWFPWSKEEGRLLLIAHHLVMDGVSWRIVLEDIETIYSQVATGKPITLPAKTSSYRQWAEHLQARAMAAEIESQRDQWQQVKRTTLPQDKLGLNSEESVDQVQLLLTSQETDQLLTETTRRTHATVEEILLTALTQSLQQWTGDAVHTIHMEGHGRDEQEGIDLSRTVGWFTSLYPVMFKPKSSSVSDVLQVVKETVRERSKQGISYGLLQHLHPNPLPAVHAPISFNYLGQFRSNEQTDQAALIHGNATESTGKSIAPEAVRPHMIDVVAVMNQGRLQITWLYSKNIHYTTSLEQLKNYFHSYLQSLMMGKEKNVGMTASDFPEADLSKKDMQKVLQLLKKKSKGR